MSLGAIVFVGAVAWGATGAFFSDTETSSGNTFSAGDIDLKIDNTSYVTSPTGALVTSPNNTWTISDLTNQLFFSFADLKPGDVGEDTISVHAGSNDAYACMAADINSTPENGLNEPEVGAGDVTDGTQGGELQNFLNFAFWNDDGDNVYETNEGPITFSGTAASLFNGVWHTIADSGTGAPIPGSATRYVGKAWCFGTLTPAPYTAAATGTPIVSGTGFTCSGAGDNNIAQTDGINVDVSFYATQARNNGSFLCSGLPAFNGTGGQTALVGSNFALRAASGTCNVTVGATSTNTTIAAGINAATDGQTVCVNPGTYAGSVTLNKGVKLVATGGPGVTTITGGVDITADNASVSGFKVTPAAIGIGPTIASFFVEDAANNASITDNDIDGTGVSNPGGTRGIILAEGGSFNNVLIQNNSIHDFTSDIYNSTITSAAGDAVTIKWNDIEVDNPADNGAGGAAGIGQLNDAVVTFNNFTTEIANGEAIGAGSDYEATNVINTNNFLNGARVNDYGAVPQISAENNFWNLGGVNQTTTGEVDFTPEAVAQYGHR
jgi:predicted ribosomally synthesized peptide with SipW-like signal peptide